MIVAMELGTLTEPEARQQINRIKGHWQAFWFELKDFHERQGWLPLGYTSFKACVEQELGISEQRAYQLLDAARMRAELDTQPGLSIGNPTERQLRELKLLEPEQRLEIARAVDFSAISTRELKAVIRERKDERRIERLGLKQAIPPDLPAATDRYQVHLCDLLDTPIRPSSIDCIVTDPPYAKEYLPVYESLARKAAEWLKPGGSLLVMLGHSYLPEVVALMTPHIRYHWMLAYLTPGGQSPHIWARRVNTFWKPVLWFVNGEYDGNWIGDVARSAVNDNDKRFHEWGQSESGMADLVERFTYPGQTVLDPFMGAGTTGVVSLKMNRLFVGVDLDATAFEIAKERLRDAASS